MFTYMHFYACWHETPATKHFQNCLIYCDCCCLFFLSSSSSSSVTGNTRDNGQHSCWCVLFHSAFSHLFIYLFHWQLWLCVCVRVLACEWLARGMHVCMYVCIHVTARSGPLYVCVMYVSRCMCARGRQACSSRSSASKPWHDKKKRKEKKLRNALFSLITEEILGVTVKPSRLEQSARDEMRLKNARKCTKSHSEVYFCLKIGHNFS